MAADPVQQRHPRKPVDPLRFHHKHRETGDFGDSFPQRMADKIAEGIGTTTFLLIALVLIVLWIAVNGGYAYFSGAIEALGKGKGFDPAPWVLLNLVFSFEAFFTGSLVVIAAKAQAKRDRAREEAEAKHREDLAAEQAGREAQMTTLLQSNTDLTQQVHDLTEQVHTLLIGNAPTPDPPAGLAPA